MVRLLELKANVHKNISRQDGNKRSKEDIQNRYVFKVIVVQIWKKGNKMHQIRIVGKNKCGFGLIDNKFS